MRDVAEILDELGPGRPAAPARGDRRLPRRLPPRATPRACAPSRARCSPAIPGLELREIAEAELCCGSAGIYNILNPEPARELGDRKAANIVATGAAAAGHRQPRLPDAGHLAPSSAPGHPMGMAHTVEVLDASIRGLPGRALLAGPADPTAPPDRPPHRRG